MKKWIIVTGLFLTFLALNTWAYDQVSFSPRLKYPKLYKFELIQQPSGKKSKCLWFNSSPLDNQWQTISFSFISKGDGWVGLRLGVWSSWREGDIPFYFDDIQVNGTPVKMDDKWIFGQPPSGNDNKVGSLYDTPGFTPSGKPCLRLYYGSGAASHDLQVKKGEKIVITMRAKAGSVLDAYVARLSTAETKLDECIKIATHRNGPADGGKSATGKLTKCINDLMAMSAKEMKVSVALLPNKTNTLEELRKKLFELIDVYKAEMKRTANEKKPILYNKLKIRKAFLSKFRQLILLTKDLKTDLVLSLMFKKEF